MLKQCSLPTLPEMRIDQRGKKHNPSSLYSPRQNHLLASLPAEDYERLVPDLEFIALPHSGAVYGAGEREDYVYFLCAGLVSQFYETETGASAAFEVTGSVGMMGIASFLGGASTASQTSC